MCEDSVGVGGSKDEPCRLRNVGGSECGTCPCERPDQCPDPPRVTPLFLQFLHIMDQYDARMESMGNAV